MSFARVYRNGKAMSKGHHQLQEPQIPHQREKLGKIRPSPPPSILIPLVESSL